MYTCGPTVWDYAHIGNFRTFLFEDILRRYLKFRGYRVTQVMNITDVEDRIIRGIKEKGMSRKELTKFYEEAFMQDLKSLGIEQAEFYPRATDHIPNMIELIKALMKKGYAYRGEDGSIYYDISKFKAYGRLSGIKPRELKAGARVSHEHYEKKEAGDFAVWKAWDQDDGEVYWETELGKGRPGWHIECSAMSMHHLGRSFDIHTGGIDNKFPHHENEIAQSEAATGRKFVNYWLHSELLNIAGMVMSKSKGNIVRLRDLLKESWGPLTIRLFLISAHYREPTNLTDKALQQAQAQSERLQQFLQRLKEVRGSSETHARDLARDLLTDFGRAMDRDLNTPIALSVVFTFVKQVNSLIDRGRLSRREASRVIDALKRVNAVLGIMTFEEEALPERLLVLIRERDEARRVKDFARADEIRRKLLEEGVLLEDTPEGTVWRRETRRVKESVAS